MLTILLFTVLLSVFNEYLELSKIKATLTGFIFGIALSSIFTLFAPKEIYVKEAEYILSFKQSVKMSGSMFTGFGSEQYFSYHAFTADGKSIVQKELKNEYVYFYPYNTQSPFMAHINVHNKGIWKLIALPFDKKFCTQIYMPPQFIIRGT